MGKRALVTGANTGIGKEIARGLARGGMEVILGCRDKDRGEAALRELTEDTGNKELSLMILDLARLASIREFARGFVDRFDHLDVLVNNAGVSHQKYDETGDGFELVFGVNFLGPFLLTNLLLPALEKAPPSRIVNVASSVHTNGHIDRRDPQMIGRWENRKAYANSKLADILFTRELARRLEGTGVTANCFNPGLVRSEFFRNYHPIPFMLRIVLKLMGKSPAEGADTGIYLASSYDVAAMTGGYYEKRALKEPSEEARDGDLARWLWDYAETRVGLTDPVDRS
jgi:NAD(P)-dependent dehydrogenase (short-subunit alcohol dehydrogenase family)